MTACLRKSIRIPDMLRIKSLIFLFCGNVDAITGGFVHQHLGASRASYVVNYVTMLVTVCVIRLNLVKIAASVRLEDMAYFHAHFVADR